jgi:hypothetical protein
MRVLINYPPRSSLRLIVGPSKRFAFWLFSDKLLYGQKVVLLYVQIHCLHAREKWKTIDHWKVSENKYSKNRKCVGGAGRGQVQALPGGRPAPLPGHLSDGRVRGAGQRAGLRGGDYERGAHGGRHVYHVGQGRGGAAGVVQGPHAGDRGYPTQEVRRPEVDPFYYTSGGTRPLLGPVPFLLF